MDSLTLGISRKAAERGDAKAQSSLAYCYENGEGLRKNLKVAVSWYRKAAEQGDGMAQIELSRCYEHGIGLKRNIGEAARWLLKAGEQGDAALQYRIAGCYSSGNLLKKDKAMAMKWLRMSAEKGLADAQYILGWHCLNEGHRLEAAKWVLNAAEQGHIDAQEYMGFLYEFGVGVKQDLKEAAKWFRKVVADGCLESDRHLDRVNLRCEAICGRKSRHYPSQNQPLD